MVVGQNDIGTQMVPDPDEDDLSDLDGESQVTI